MQTLGELRAIPLGTPVVAHLFRGASDAEGETRRRITEELGWLDIAHVGKTHGPFLWTPNFVSAAWQDTTRYVFFDPGDDILQAMDWARGMSVHRYLTPLHEPAALIVPSSGHPVQFESHTDGFGMSWSTHLDVASALAAVLELIPPAEPEDEATIVHTPRRVERMSTSSVRNYLSEYGATVVLAQLDVGTAAVTWAAGKESLSPAAGMTFGDDYYQRDLVTAILSATLSLPPTRALDQVMTVADETLLAHLPPAA